MCQSKGVILSSRDFCPGGEAPPSSSDLGKGQRRERSPHGHGTVCLTFPAQGNLEADLADAGAEVILRRCPICEQDSIVGHGRRRKQAHDGQHDWIGVRRVLNRFGERPGPIVGRLSTVA